MECAPPYCVPSAQPRADAAQPGSTPRRPGAAQSAGANAGATRPAGPTPAPVRALRTKAAPIALLTFVAAMSFGRPSLARLGGIAAEGCDGCHRGGEVTTVSLESNVDRIDPSQAVTLTISVAATNGPAAGFFLSCSDGTFQIVDSGTRALSPDGVTHVAPREGTGSEITFAVGWTAPAQVGGVDFLLYGVSASNDGTNSGDATGATVVSYAVGCEEGITYYRDFDGDGYGGVNADVTVSCVPPPLYAPFDGDCDDNTAAVYPGAPELCDGRDNDCDGQIDENLPIDTYCQDDDGDGHGVRGLSTVQDCGPTRGFGLCDDDCSDGDEAIYPGAPELCNGIDDNCDGRIDEGVLPTCGIGWCRSYATGCSSTSACFPGAPREEECNLFDDDCDGVDDNGTDLELCGSPGLTCRLGECVAVGSGSMDAGGASADAGRASADSENREGADPIDAVGGPSGPDADPSPPPGRDAPGCAVSPTTRSRTGPWWAAAGSWFAASWLAAVAGLRRRSRRRARSHRRAGLRSRVAQRPQRTERAS